MLVQYSAHPSMKGLFESPLFYFEQVSSTIDIAEEIITRQTTTNYIIPIGTTIYTNYQFNGKGQQEKNWVSKSNKSLLFSILLDIEQYDTYNIKINRPTHFALVLANSIIKSILYLFSQQHNTKKLSSIKMKWPNDILINNKKVSGILVHVKKNIVILSAGINVCSQNWHEEIKENLNIYPTSLQESGIITTAKDFYEILLNFLQTDVLSELNEVLNFTNENLWQFGNKVLYKNQNTEEHVKIIAIGKDASLLVEAEGKVKSIYVGSLFSTT